MIVLAEPDPSDMVHAVQKAISMLPNIDPQVMHNRVSLLFKWSFSVAFIGETSSIFVYVLSAGDGALQLE